MSKMYTIDVFNFQSQAFDLGSVTVQRTFDVSYYRNANSGGYVLTLIADNKQRLEVSAAFFRKMTGVSERAICGVYDFTRDELTRLGFVKEEVVC